MRISRVVWGNFLFFSFSVIYSLLYLPHVVHWTFYTSISEREREKKTEKLPPIELTMMITMSWMNIFRCDDDRLYRNKIKNSLPHSFQYASGKLLFIWFFLSFLYLSYLHFIIMNFRLATLTLVIASFFIIIIIVFVFICIG